MDSTLIAAVISGLGAALATAGGAVLRARTNVRTAARLIYAELTRNSAAVMYFRQTSHWVAPTLSRRAWDEHGAIIARRRSSASFEAVHRGYEALEIVPVLADESLEGEVRDRLLRDAVQWLVQAISELGKIAHISPGRIRETTDWLDVPPAAPAERLPTHHQFSTGAVPLPLLERLTVVGATFWQAGQIPQPAAVADRAEPVLGAEPVDAEHIVYDAKHRENLDRLVPARWTGQPPTGDQAVDEAYEGLVAVSAFGREVLGRDPLSERPLIAFVHYGSDFNNAWWDGEQLVLGDGDGTLFGRFSQCLDVIGGEVWHGVREMLQYFGWEGEHGALHASLCDVFGQLFKQYALDQTVEEADWVVGSGLLLGGTGLRSMKAPGTAYDNDILGRDPQPAHMDNYVRTARDNGGIHINCGIPNRAFYLVAERLGGKAWEGAGRIWWEALTGGGVRRGLLFADWARLTAAAACACHGSDSVEHRAVLEAWNQVGVPVTD